MLSFCVLWAMKQEDADRMSCIFQSWTHYSWLLSSSRRLQPPGWRRLWHSCSERHISTAANCCHSYTFWECKPRNEKSFIWTGVVIVVSMTFNCLKRQGIIEDLNRADVLLPCGSNLLGCDHGTQQISRLGCSTQSTFHLQISLQKHIMRQWNMCANSWEVFGLVLEGFVSYHRKLYFNMKI